jgi:hypothetical protein
MIFKPDNNFKISVCESDFGSYSSIIFCMITIKVHENLIYSFYSTEDNHEKLLNLFQKITECNKEQENIVYINPISLDVDLRIEVENNLFYMTEITSYKEKNKKRKRNHETFKMTIEINENFKKEINKNLKKIQNINFQTEKKNNNNNDQQQISYISLFSALLNGTGDQILTKNYDETVNKDILVIKEEENKDFYNSFSEILQNISIKTDKKAVYEKILKFIKGENKTFKNLYDLLLFLLEKEVFESEFLSFLTKDVMLECENNKNFEKFKNYYFETYKKIIKELI